MQTGVFATDPWPDLAAKRKLRKRRSSNLGQPETGGLVTPAYGPSLQSHRS